MRTASTLKTLPLLIFLGLACAQALAGQGQTVKVDIASQPLGDALSKFAEQTGIQLVYHSRVARGLQSPRVVGTFTTDAALAKLLSNTGLSYEYLDASTVAIRAAKEERSLSGATAAEQMRLSMAAEDGGSKSAAPTDGKDEKNAGADVLVQSTRVLNTDLPRTVDDPKAYYIFDAATIERSGATSIEDFLNRRLTMNSNYIVSTARTISNSTPYSMTTGTMALRGLSAAQTLVLVNGRRLPNGTSGSQDQPPDMNSIPLGMIERIEVLPSSGSGIYGAGALGGVINIITKRNHTGGEIRAVYNNSFSSDTAKRSVDANYGFMLEGGRTQVMVSAGYSDSDFLLVQDRLDMIRDNLARVTANNPEFLRMTSPLLGTTPRVTSDSGGPLVLRGGQSLGAPFVFLPPNYRGPTVDGTAVLIANAGRLDPQWPNTQQYSHGLREPMTNVGEVESVRADIRRQMTPWLEVFVEGGYESNFGHSLMPLFNGGGVFIAATVPTNPFNSAVVVQFPFDAAFDYETRSARVRAAGGMTFRLPRDWQLTADHSWIEGKVDTWSTGQDIQGLTPALNSGQMNLFIDLMTQPNSLGTFIARTRVENEQYLRESTLRANGALGSILGLEPTLAVGAQYREEGRGELYIGTTFPNRPAGDRLGVSAPQSQTVSSVYAEITLPLVTDQRSRAGLRLLDLQLAGRRDEYTVHSNRSVIGTGGATSEYASTNPTYGLRYKPFESLMLRAAYAKGFIAPTYAQMTPNVTPTNPTNVQDPRRNNQATGVIIYSGGNTGLTPETGENWTAGVVFTPATFPGLRMALDYTQVRKQNNIATVAAQLVVNNESLFPGRVVRAAPVSGDPFGVGRITSVDASLTNLFSTSLEAYDLSVTYRMPATARGTFTLESLSTVQPHYLQRIAFGAPILEYADTPAVGGPLHFRSNLSLTWEYQSWQAGWTSYYYDSYKQNAAPFTTSTDSVLNQGGSEVPSQIFHDLFVSYRFPDAPATGRLHALLDRTEIQLGIRNVFNTRPAFDGNANSPYFLSPLTDYRLATYALSLRRGF